MGSYLWLGTRRYDLVISTNIFDGTSDLKMSPVATNVTGVLSGATIVDVAAGYSSTMVLTSTGKLYSFGKNLYGQLGDNTTTDSYVPVTVVLPPGKLFKSIFGGPNSQAFFALTTTNELYGVGYSIIGVYGSYVPNIKTLSKINTTTALGNAIISGIGLGGSHSVFLDTTGKLYGVGANNAGQLADGTTSSFYWLPFALNMSYIAGTVVAIDAGQKHTIALTNNGVVYCWGDGTYGQIGVSTTNH